MTKAILEAYKHGISNFISGFAIGIDLMAAQIVQSLKSSCPGMTLTAAIPFRGQADRFSANDKIVYENLIASADEVLILSERYYTRCFLDRDEFMVENVSLLIAFYDGREKGGTYYTFKKANHLGIPGGRKINCVMRCSRLNSSVGDRPAPRGGTTRPDERKVTTI